MVGQIVLAEVSVVFNLTTALVVLGAFWLIGAAAGILWRAKGVEARGVSVDVLGFPAARMAAGSR